MTNVLVNSNIVVVVVLDILSITFVTLSKMGLPTDAIQPISNEALLFATSYNLYLS